MSITARIAIGLSLVAGLLIGVLAYELSVVDRLQRINEELSRTNVEAARISVLLLEGLAGVGEFAAKASVLQDAEYRRQWTDWEESVAGALEQLSLVGLSGQEDAIRSRIQAGWGNYREVAPLLWDDPSHLSSVQLVLGDMRREVNDLITVNERAVSARVQNSAAAGEEARLVAWSAALVALLVAGAASLLMSLSISGPLRRLTSGTRELARGRFDHRLEENGPAELAALAGDFNHMAARLDELEDLKRDFVSHVSHELKTPLAALQETIEVLLERIPGPLTAKQAHLLELSRKSSARLSAMIGDLLEASRLEAGAANYHPDRHRLGEIVQSLLDEMQPLAEEWGIVLVLEDEDDSGLIVCDGERIRDVIANLVGNALKFSPEGSTVRVEVSRAERLPTDVPRRRDAPINRERGPFLLLSVEDEGRGVPDEHKERIFNKFHQVERGARIRGQGVGLGLSISRQVVEGHGGAVWVEDGARGGARFRVVLPAVPTRWEAMAEDMDEGKPASTVDLTGERRAAGFASSHRSSARAMLVLLALSATTGCIGLGAAESAPPEPPPPVVQPVVTEVVAPVTEPLLSPEAARLIRAHALLQFGAFEEAARDFQRVLDLAPSGDERAGAMWGMTLVYLIPESPLRDPSLALELLHAMEGEFPDSLPGIQARWARMTLGELAGTKQVVQEQRALIEELNEALAALRQIDLDRRPAAPSPARGTGAGARPQP